MRKLKLLKNLSLNVSLIVLLIVGLYSCGSEESTDVDQKTETEEVIIIETEKPDDNTEVKKATKTRVVTRKDENLKVNSKSEGAELDEDFGDIGFEETYNYLDVDVPPVFDECEEKVSKEEMEECFEKFLMKNLHKNIKYPESSKELNVEGKTYIGFVMDKTGVISQVKIMKGSGAEYEKTEKAINEYIDAYNALDQAALVAIKATPKTRPAMVNGEPVNVQYVIPVVFEVE